MGHKLPSPRPDLLFYQQCLELLRDAKVPYLVGGAYAIRHHCGVKRDTKDLDLFLRREHVDDALGVLAEAGHQTDKVFPHWLAKAYSGDRFLDLIFSSGNGISTVDDGWFEHAAKAELLGVEVDICPAEETLWSKAFIMERERYDGADVAHLLAARVDDLDWERLLFRFGAHWRILFSHLVLFGFVYPAEAQRIPGWVMDRLMDNLSSERPHGDKVCRGTLLSREQYLIDLKRGYVDARLPPNGSMTHEEVTIWTAAIMEKR